MPCLARLAPHFRRNCWKKCLYRTERCIINWQIPDWAAPTPTSALLLWLVTYNLSFHYFHPRVELKWDNGIGNNITFYGCNTSYKIYIKFVNSTSLPSYYTDNKRQSQGCRKQTCKRLWRSSEYSSFCAKDLPLALCRMFSPKNCASFWFWCLNRLMIKHLYWFYILI